MSVSASNKQGIDACRQPSMAAVPPHSGVCLLLQAPYTQRRTHPCWRSMRPTWPCPSCPGSPSGGLRHVGDQAVRGGDRGGLCLPEVCGALPRRPRRWTARTRGVVARVRLLEQSVQQQLWARERERWGALSVISPQPQCEQDVARAGTSTHTRLVLVADVGGQRLGLLRSSLEIVLWCTSCQRRQGRAHACGVATRHVRTSRPLAEQQLCNGVAEGVTEGAVFC